VVAGRGAAESAADDGRLGVSGPAGGPVSVGPAKPVAGRLPQDLSLGLGEVGRLAFTAFWIYGAGFVPVLVVNVANPIGLLLILGLFLLGVGVFFACLEGLHRQLLAARRHYLAWAGQLYARAYEPIRSGSLAGLGEQAQLLQAAEVIHRRAEAIQQWPFQQRRLVQMAGIVGSVVTFVVTGIITRLVLVSLGL
jgi:hypothetical protein